MIKTVAVGPGRHLAYWENGVQVGEILMDVDGYWKWWPDNGQGGFLDEWFLYTMFNKLKEMNKAWDEQVTNDLGSGHGEHDLVGREPLRSEEL